ncbi:MAG: hypothetical protein Q4B12_05090 [Bowdeniella nasicola]|nr:hypothetical protein [Bowdeniella nasicola]
MSNSPDRRVEEQTHPARSTAEAEGIAAQRAAEERAAEERAAAERAAVKEQKRRDEVIEREQKKVRAATQARDKAEKERQRAVQRVQEAGGSAPRQSSALPWIALIFAVIVVGLQCAYAYSTGQVIAGSGGTSYKVFMFTSLVLSLVTVVIATVALAQRSKHRWACLVSLGVGINVLVVSIAAWLGGIATSTV